MSPIERIVAGEVDDLFPGKEGVFSVESAPPVIELSQADGGYKDITEPVTPNSSTKPSKEDTVFMGSNGKWLSGLGDVVEAVEVAEAEAKRKANLDADKRLARADEVRRENAFASDAEWERVMLKAEKRKLRNIAQPKRSSGKLVNKIKFGEKPKEQTISPVHPLIKIKNLTENKNSGIDQKRQELGWFLEDYVYYASEEIWHNYTKGVKIASKIKTAKDALSNYLHTQLSKKIKTDLTDKLEQASYGVTWPNDNSTETFSRFSEFENKVLKLVENNLEQKAKEEGIALEILSTEEVKKREEEKEGLRRLDVTRRKAAKEKFEKTVDLFLASLEDLPKAS